MRTVICDLLNIEYPILQGGMAWVADASLASAVSNAGGLGIIAAGTAPVDHVRNEIRKVKELTDKPFGVNIMLLSPYADEIAKLVVEEGVKVLTTGAGMPTKYMKEWNEHGIKVIPVVPSVAIAKMVERAGAHAVIAEGTESGGHIGELTTMTLVPQVCDAVSIPVIAAGGIGDGRGMAAALMLGAVGFQLGTKFLVANECTIHQNYKDKIIKAGDIATMATGRRLGHPVRALKNPFTREYLKREYDSSITDAELEAYGTGALRKATLNGDEKDGCFMSGQICAMVTKEQSAKDIITELFANLDVVLDGKCRCRK